MLLKDCPVGSVVRLVSFYGSPADQPWWQGNFTVEKGLSGNFVTDNDEAPRKDLYNDPNYQFEIVAPAPTPEPRITFTVGGQEFYVGQRVWNLEDGGILKSGEEIEILGVMPHSDEYVTVRKTGTHQVCQAESDLLSDTPPTPHEWKRGDWARHEDGSVYLVVKVMDNKIVLTGCGFADCAEMKQAHPRDPKLTFITHTEIPK